MKCRPGFDGVLDQAFLLEVEEVPFIFSPFHNFHDDDDGNVDDHDDGGGDDGDW